MICKQCGSSLRPGSTSCAKCGARLEASLDCGGFSNLAAQAREGGASGFAIPGDPGMPASSKPAAAAPSRPVSASDRFAPPRDSGSVLTILMLMGLVACLILSIVSCSRSGKLEDTVNDLQNQITQLGDDLHDLPKEDREDDSSIPGDTTADVTDTQPDDTKPMASEALSGRNIKFFVDLETGEYFCNDDELQKERKISDSDDPQFVFAYTGLVEQGVSNLVELEISMDKDDVEVSYDLDRGLFGTREGFIECRWYDAVTGVLVYSNEQVDTPEVSLKYKSMTAQCAYLRCELVRCSQNGGTVTLTIDNIPVPSAR